MSSRGFQLGIWARAVLAGLILIFPAGAMALEGFYGEWSSALNAAKSSGKPLFVVFAHEGCPECAKLESVLAGERARQALDNAVKLLLEYSDYPQLADRYNVSATPTLILLSPDSNWTRCVYRDVGSQSVAEILAIGRRIDSMVAAPRKTEPTAATSARQTAQPATANPAPKAKTTKSSRKSTRPPASSYSQGDETAPIFIPRRQVSRSATQASRDYDYYEGPTQYNDYQPW
ncbi:MAG: thioredoxin family protein [Candidatus Sumerlaeaceae bacterium]|nr:thioredoxin family protein [Candidatus Sumerlaeaceae bacterium]